MQEGESTAPQGVLLQQNFNTLLNHALKQRGIEITPMVVNVLIKRCMNKIVTSLDNMSNSHVKRIFSREDPQDKSKVLCMLLFSSSSSSLGKICGNGKNSGPSKFRIHVISCSAKRPAVFQRVILFRKHHYIGCR